MAPSPRVCLSVLLGGGGTGAERNNCCLGDNVRRPELQGEPSGSVLTYPPPTPCVLKVRPWKPRIGEGPTAATPALHPPIPRPPGSPRTGRAARWPVIAPSAASSRTPARCTQRRAWPPGVVPGPGSPILLLSPSPPRPINQAASAFSQTPLVAAALCSCCRADKRGKWSKPGRPGRKQRLFVFFSNFGGRGARRRDCCRDF